MERFDCSGIVPYKDSLAPSTESEALEEKEKEDDSVSIETATGGVSTDNVPQIPQEVSIPVGNPDGCTSPPAKKQKLSAVLTPDE